MRAHAFLAGLPALLLMIATGSARGDDGQVIHRCLGHHGEIVFSGLPCAATDAAGADLPGTANAATPADTCPASRAELRERIGAALARNDPNALASLLQWRGVGAEATRTRLRVLRELAERPLLAIDDDSVPGTDDAPAAADLAAPLRVRTGGATDGGVREHRFGVHRDGACLWLTW